MRLTILWAELHSYFLKDREYWYMNGVFIKVLKQNFKL
jgi:hypothetical protein